MARTSAFCTFPGGPAEENTEKSILSSWRSTSRIQELCGSVYDIHGTGKWLYTNYGDSSGFWEVRRIGSVSCQAMNNDGNLVFKVTLRLKKVSIEQRWHFSVAKAFLHITILFCYQDFGTRSLKIADETPGKNLQEVSTLVEERTAWTNIGNSCWYPHLIILF